MAVNQVQLKKAALYLLLVVLIIAIASSRYYGDDYHVSLASTCDPIDREAQFRALLNGQNYWANQRKLVENEIIFLSPENSAQMESLSSSVLAPYPTLRESVAAGRDARLVERAARLRELVALYNTCKAKRSEWTRK